MFEKARVRIADEALKEYLKMPHGSLELKAREKLKKMGYEIVKREQAPEWIKRIGSPDIIARKGDKYVIVEVKPSDQLRRYSQTEAKLVIVTSVVEGRTVEIWGEKELSS